MFEDINTINELKQTIELLRAQLSAAEAKIESLTADKANSEPDYDELWQASCDEKEVVEYLTKHYLYDCNLDEELPQHQIDLWTEKDTLARESNLSIAPTVDLSGLMSINSNPGYNICNTF